jgi:hypothetical protein
MNRTVEKVLDDLTANKVGKGLLILIKASPQGYEKYKKYYFTKDGIPDPIPLIKYAIRLCYTFQGTTLNELREPKDPYRTVSFRWFNGRFEYDANREAYVPVKIARNGSETMRKLWASAEQRRIKRAWGKARDVLQGKDGKSLQLVTEPE